MEPSGSSLIITATISIFFSIICSLGKYALAYISPAKFEGMLETKRARDRFTKYWERREKIMLALSIVSTFANFLLIVTLILFFAKDGHVTQESLLFAASIALSIIILLCKGIPEVLAKIKPESILLGIWNFTNIIYWLLCWLAEPIYRIISPLEKFFQPAPIVASAEAIEKEILSVVQEGQKEGVLQETEKEMIEAIIELKDSEVQEVMTPRTDIFCLALDSPIETLIGQIVNEGHSRIPIYKENKDDIIGILYIKDLLQYWEQDTRNDLKLEKLIRHPYFVPETKRIGSLLMEFQKQKIHMAVVVDEYGGTAGIVTIEDIIEEIVGEIQDEYDGESYTPFRFIQENIVEVDARFHVDELNEILDVEIPSDEGYETIGGFLFSFIGHIPKKAETFYWENIEFTVLEVSPRRIDRLKVTKLDTKQNVNQEDI